MALEHQEWWHFGYKNHLLLVDLYYHKDWLSEADIYDYIKKNRADNSSRPPYILAQLKKLKFIQPVPESTAHFEVQILPCEIIEFLEREYRFTSSKQIASFLEEIDEYRKQLEEAFKRNSEARIEAYLRDISTNIDKLRQSSNGNKLAIINSVIEIKTNRKKETTTVRYEKIADINERFLAPLDDMIRERGSMDLILEKLDRALKHAKENNILDRGQIDKINRVEHQIPTLRSDLNKNHREAITELTPLLNRLKANLFSRGVTEILRRVEKKGESSLDSIVEQLSLPPTGSHQQLFDGNKTLEFLLMARDFKPIPPPQIHHEKRDIVKPTVINQDSLIKNFKKALPVQDTFAWVIENYHETDLSFLLEIYRNLMVRAADYKFKPDKKTYDVQEYLIHAHPLQITDIRQHEKPIRSA